MLGIVPELRKFLSIASSHEVEQVLSLCKTIGFSKGTLRVSDDLIESVVESVVADHQGE